MRVVVVGGGTGFLGRHVVEKFEAAGHEVGTASVRPGLREMSLRSTFLMKNAELVVNCAGVVGGIGYYKSLGIQKVVTQSIEIAWDVVKATTEANVPYLINILPNCVYPDYPGALEEWMLLKDHPHESVYEYAMARRLIVPMCEAMKDAAPTKTVHLVLGNLYGPGDHIDDPLRCHALGAIVAKVLKAKREGRGTVELWGTGKPVREWLYVEDAAEAVLRAAIGMGQIGKNEACNVTSMETPRTIAEVAGLVAKAVRWEGEFVCNTSFRDGPMAKRLALWKMKEWMGWMPPTTLEDGIEKTVKWAESIL